MKAKLFSLLWIVSLFFSLILVRIVFSPIVPTGWVDRYAFVKDNGEGTYTWTGSISPQTFWDNKTDSWQELEFVKNDTYPYFITWASVANCTYFVRNSHVALEITNNSYVKLWNPDYTQVSVYTEQWTVEYWRATGGGRWADTGIGFQPNQWSISQDSDSVNITRIQSLVGVGQLNVTYVLRKGMYLKHEAVFQSWDSTAYDYRLVMSLAGIVSSHVKTDTSEFDISGERHEYSSRFLVGQNSTNMVYQEYLESVYNQTVGNLTDIVFNTHAQGIKANIIIGNWNLVQNQMLNIDPETSTFPVSHDDYDGHSSQVNGNYNTGHDAEVGVSSSAIIIYTGQNWIDPNYYIYRAVCRFDTSSLSTSVIAAKLCLGGYTDYSTDDFVIRLQKWTEASDGITTADYNGFDGTDYDDGLFSTSTWSSTEYNNITITNFDLIVIGGYTDICIRSQEDISSSSPTSSEYVRIDDTGNPQPAKLEVTCGSIPEYDYIDNNTSDVDSSADKGTHSSFTAQKYTDSVNDTLIEANTAGYSNSTLINDGFESGTTNWDGNGGSGFTRVNSYTASGETINPHGGSWFMVAPESTASQYLSCDDLDMSTAVAIYVSFWYYDDDLDTGDLTLSYWDGDSYEGTVDLALATESQWNQYTAKLTTYFVSDFHIRFDATTGNNEAGGIDDVLIIRETLNTPNYELDLEEQFTSANFSRTYVELCVRMGDFNTTEDLALDYWNASAEAWIQISAALTENDWNNASVKAYTSNASVTFTIRFRGTAESGDEERSAWNKDACLLHTWDVAGNVETIVSFASLNFSSGNTESESITKTFNAVLSFSSSTLKTITKPLYSSASLSFSANSIVSVSQTLSIIASALVSFSTTILNTFSKTLTGNAPLSFSPSNTKTVSFPAAGEATMTFSANRIATETVSLAKNAGLSLTSTITKTFSETLAKSANLGFSAGNIRTLAFPQTTSATMTFTANHMLSETKSIVQSATLTFAVSTIKTFTESLTKTVSLSFLTENIKTLTFSKTTSASLSFLTYHIISPTESIVQSASLTFTSGMGKTITKSLITSANLGFLTGNVRSFTLSRIASASLSFTTGNIISSLRLISIIQSASLSFQTGILKTVSTSLVKTATLTFSASNIQALQTSLIKSASLNFLTGKIATSLISLQKSSTLTFLTDNQKQITFPIAPYASLSLSPFNIKTINFPITSFATLSLMANSVVSAVQNVLNIISSASLSFASSIITSFTITKTMSSTLQLDTFNMKTLTMPITANAPLSFAAQGIASALQNILSITGSALLSFLSSIIETTTITKTSSASLIFTSAISKTLTKPLINYATLTFASGKIVTPIPNLIRSASLAFSSGNIKTIIFSKTTSASLSFLPNQMKTLSLPIIKSASLTLANSNLATIAESLTKTASLTFATATDKFIALPITSSASLIFSAISQVSASAYGIINILASAILNFQTVSNQIPSVAIVDMDLGLVLGSFGAVMAILALGLVMVKRRREEED